MRKKVADAGARGSFDGWLQAAYDTLIRNGVDSVRIMPLSERVKLSRTSFYWFFKDRDALLRALLERWKAKNTANLIRQSEAYAESITEAILNVFDCWLDTRLFDSKFEFAVRNWAQGSDDVAAEIVDADTNYVEIFTSSPPTRRELDRFFARHGYSEGASGQRAQAGRAKNS